MFRSIRLFLLLLLLFWGFMDTVSGCTLSRPLGWSNVSSVQFMVSVPNYIQYHIYAPDVEVSRGNATFTYYPFIFITLLSFGTTIRVTHELLPDNPLFFSDTQSCVQIPPFIMFGNTAGRLDLFCIGNDPCSISIEMSSTNPIVPGATQPYRVMSGTADTCTGSTACHSSLKPMLIQQKPTGPVCCYNNATEIQWDPFNKVWVCVDGEKRQDNPCPRPMDECLLGYSSSCTECTNSPIKPGCGWCESTQTCMASLYGPAVCNTTAGWTSKPSSQCSSCSATSCVDCTAQSGCNWCSSKKKCVSMLDRTCPGEEEEEESSTKQCQDVVRCQQRKTCSECLAAPANYSCGWCDVTRQCSYGDPLGEKRSSYDHLCDARTGAWYYGGNGGGQCPAVKQPIAFNPSRSVTLTVNEWKQRIAIQQCEKGSVRIRYLHTQLMSSSCPVHGIRLEFQYVYQDIWTTQFIKGANLSFSMTPELYWPEASYTAPQPKNRASRVEVFLSVIPSSLPPNASCTIGLTIGFDCPQQNVVILQEDPQPMNNDTFDCVFGEEKCPVSDVYERSSTRLQQRLNYAADPIPNCCLRPGQTPQEVGFRYGMIILGYYPQCMCSPLSYSWRGIPLPGAKYEIDTWTPCDPRTCLQTQQIGCSGYDRYFYQNRFVPDSYCANVTSVPEKIRVCCTISSSTSQNQKNMIPLLFVIMFFVVVFSHFSQ